MTSIGDRLRQERLRRGLDIDRLAEQTKINPSMLEAIEADDLEKLPGSFFTRSFVRQYARALGLDEDEFEPELKRLTSVEEQPASEAATERHELDFLPPVPRSTGPGSSRRHWLGALIAFVLIVAACSAIYTLWQRTRENGKKELAAEVAPQRSAGLPPATKAPVPAARPERPPAAETPPPAETPQSETPQAAPAAATLSSVPVGETAGIRIQMRATAEAWVRVTADGKVLYSGTLQPGESKNFEAKSSLSVRAGDPAALEITSNGQAIGEIGPSGQPRTVQFTPEGFKVLTPAAAKAASPRVKAATPDDQAASPDDKAVTPAPPTPPIPSAEP
jgi:cytoskeletal protein RodZ